MPPAAATAIASPRRRTSPACRAGEIGRARALAPDRPVGHPAGGHLRRQRRPGEQPLAGHGRGRRARPSPGSSCSPGSPASSPARSAWPPASTSRCRASASCSSARSPSSGPRWRRCPTRRRPSSRRIYRAKGFTADEADTIAAPHLPGPGGRPRHARPRGARPRPRPARLAVGRGRSGRSSRSRSGRRIPVIPYLFGGGDGDLRGQPRR